MPTKLPGAAGTKAVLSIPTVESLSTWVKMESVCWLWTSKRPSFSPHLTTNLSKWRLNIESEIQAWKRDPNRISLVPMPLGIVNFSGDGRLLLLTQELRDADDQLMIGFGLSPDVVRGSASWSGSNVSLRIVENAFLNHRETMMGLLVFIVDNVSRFLDKPKISIKMSEFKMADDLSKKQLMVQASQGGASNALFSQATISKEFDIDPDKEYKLKEEELKKRIETSIQEAEGQAEAQGQASITSALYQADAQMENQKRLDGHSRQATMEHDEAVNKEKEQNAVNVEGEAQALSNGQQISVPNLILVLTNRFARLAQINQPEFKIRMLAMKNSTPNLYHEVYNNLKEMNLIATETNPLAQTTPTNPAVEQQAMPEEGSGPDDQPSPDQMGASPPSDVVAPLPEIKPPRGPNATI